MHYIKLIILVLITGIVSAIHISGADLFMCLAIAIAFCEKDKYKGIIISAILGVVCAAVSGGYMLFYVIKYMLPALFITYVFPQNTKIDIVWGTLICVFVEAVFGYAAYKYAGSTQIWGSIGHNLISTVIAYVIYYVVIFRIINPRKRSYKITVR